MINEKLNHSDCLNFTTIDAAKGICRVLNKVVFIDTDICSSYEKLPKCKNCSFFNNPNADNVGTCTGLNKEAWTYGELIGITCEGYKSK